MNVGNVYQHKAEDERAQVIPPIWQPDNVRSCAGFGVYLPSVHLLKECTRQPFYLRGGMIDRIGNRGTQILRRRLGITGGPIVAGVLGTRKIAYDVWGDAVNTAKRMETYGLPGRVHVSAATRQALGDAFRFEPRGSLQVKGKGTMETYFLCPVR